MSSDVITLDPPNALDRLAQVMDRYRIERRKTPAEVLARTGLNLSIQLYQLFRAEAPRATAITAAAKARGWRLGRHGIPGGISSEALARATARMGNLKSILAQVSELDGRITLRGVRQGKRGRRILGGRAGRGGVAVAGDNTALRQPGDVRLNFRAVATIEEINLRESGRRFMAVSWLYRRWFRVSQADGGVRRLANLNPRSQLNELGYASLESSPANDAATLTLASNIPGIREVGEKRNIFARAMNTVRADMEQFLLQQETQQMATTLQDSLTR